MAKQVNYTTAHPNHVIHVLVAHNPKRPGTKSAAYWGLYKTGQTVAQFAAAHAQAKAAFTPNSTLNWNVARGFLAVLPPGQKPAPATPAKAK